jgi:hypothetical protein
LHNIIDKYYYRVLADDALDKLAMIYANEKNNSKKTREIFL